MSASRRDEDRAEHVDQKRAGRGAPSYAPRPGSVPPPGETLREWLGDNRRTQAWLATELGTSPKHVNRIIQGFSVITAEMALRLAEATGVTARYWMQLQVDYQLSQAQLTRHGRSDRVGEIHAKASHP